jgi:hypothetical protein
MCEKLTRGCYGLIIAIGINCACASPPPGLRETLAEFETGALTPNVCPADRVVGSRKEVSRFQILPVVWRQYSSSRNYSDPQTAWDVANKILSEREQTFRRAANRDWDAVDLYLMWNAPGVYQRANWNRAKVSRPVLERAQRFANLSKHDLSCTRRKTRKRWRGIDYAGTAADALDHRTFHAHARSVHRHPARSSDRIAR